MEKEKVLIVDEDRNGLTILFKDRYEVLAVRNGQETIEWIEKLEYKISLLVLDLDTSHEVLTYIRKHHPLHEFPIIVITSSTNLEDERRLYQDGVDEIIRKPFVYEIAMHRIENLMELYASRKKLTKKWSQNAMKYDILTGLYNKLFFLRECDTQLKKLSQEECQDYAFIYSNIRNFKYYNMKEGMKDGDKLLQKVAGHIQAFQPGILSCRFSQDHFVLFAHGQDLVSKVEKMCEIFNREYGYFGMSLKVGIYTLENNHENAAFGCECAKTACDNVRNRTSSVCVYNEKIRLQMDIHSYVIQHINEAIENNYIQVYYQPVIRTINGKTCGMEALVRWIDPVKGFLSPADFISALESNRLITQLDLYVLKEVCKGIKNIEAQGKIVVPISFNLSRIDFEECDIFKEVDKIVMEYGIARDMINIEITESAIMNDPQALKRDIERFREAGYQVWMDDFGSGYSSLNVLKEYRFDEIKLDMKFNSSFNERSKEIIASIISMSKKIGIHTLAEGVETKEQYDFLRYVGCEKVQGYFFSRPMDPIELEKTELLHPQNMEPRSWKAYYEKLGSTNFVTERPLSVVEYDGRRFNLLYANQSCRSVWESIGKMGVEEVYSYINVPSTSLGKQFKELRNDCHLGGETKEVFFTVDGCYVRLDVKCIAEFKSKIAFEIEVFNITGSNQANKRTLFENTSRVLLTMFDTVLSFDQYTNKIKVVQHSTYKGQHPHFNGQTLAQATKEAMLLIHPRERDEFIKFVDASTIQARIQDEKRYFITKYFRTLTYNGAFIWKSHTILYQVETDTYIYCTRIASISNDELIRKLVPEFKEQNSGAMTSNLQKMLRQGILESQTVNMFWKDKDRRFLGANDCFLKTYGFSDVSMILGKTDVDMGWHIENEPFAEDERRVIDHGEVLSNRIGKCIIQGVACNIVASKEPLYENGEIVGLIGYFINIDELQETFHAQESTGVIDSVTKLLSPHGLINVISEYATEWQVHQENYAAISVTIREYKRATKTYGEVVAMAMLKEIGHILTNIVGHKGSCARMYSSHFVILMKCHDKDQIQSLAQTIRQQLCNIHELCGYKATIQPEIDVAFADEPNSMFSILGITAEGPLLEKEEKKAWSLDLEPIWNSYEELNDIIYAADMDSHEVIYINRKARERIGISSLSQVKGKKCYEVIQGNDMPCANCTNPQIMENGTYQWDYFNTRINSLFRLRDQMIECNGRRIRIETATEIINDQNETTLDNKERTLLLVSECMRLALEHKDSDHGLRVLIEYLGRTLESERAFVFELNHKKEWNNTYEWCANDIQQKIPYESTTLLYEQLKDQQFVVIRSVDAMAHSDPKVYAYLKAQGIRSILAGSIHKDDQFHGFFVLENLPIQKIEEVVSTIQTIRHVISTLVEKRDMLIQLNQLSYRDSLSNLGNRHAVNEFLHAMDRSRSIGVVFCDVCGLKTVNDTLGHAAGDDLLLQVCDILKEAFQGYDIFRWGGDEMLILASSINENEFMRRCERIQYLSEELSVPIALGTVWQDNADVEDGSLIKEADQKMYQNKEKMYKSFDIKETLMQNDRLKKFKP